MNGEWKFVPAADAVSFPDGHFVFAATPDIFGARIFLATHIQWEGKAICFLDDAASAWGRAPWAMVEATASMHGTDFGTWQDFLAANQEALCYLVEARDADDALYLTSSMMFARAAMTLQSTERERVPMSVESAKRALLEEIARDARIRTEKRRSFMTKNPDWHLPEFVSIQWNSIPSWQ